MLKSFLKAEVLVPIIVGGLIFVRLETVANQVYTQNGIVSSMSSTVNQTKERVDTIIDALPNAQIFIANEELNKTFEMAIVTNKPYMVAPGKWATIIHVLDFEKQQRSTYALDLSYSNDLTSIYMLHGSVAAFDQSSASFSQYSDWAIQTNKSLSTPYYIDPKNSVIITTYSSDYNNWLYGWTGSTMTLVENAPLDSNINTWENLMKSMQENPDTYNIKYIP